MSYVLQSKQRSKDPQKQTNKQNNPTELLASKSNSFIWSISLYFPGFGYGCL